MAATSLAQQLQKLATPHTKVYASNNKKLSLLFDPSEAASIDRVTFYEIGISGLDELIEINDVFEEFRSTLFDETSKNFERAVETLEVNEKLNKIIRRFLYLLSPYFLLKPTQKVLEWLIARFRIHDYNSDELICIALPYHGTRLFARLLQVFDFQDDAQSKWNWLYPLQRKGLSLSKNVLFSHCASDSAFLKMICDFTIDCVETFGKNASKLTTLFGFYSTTVVGTLQNVSNITELHITYMLPSILKGLSSDSVDYVSSTFLIIASILIKTSFQQRIHNKLVEKICKVENLALRKSVVLTLNILYQYHDLKEAVISKEAVKHLLRNSDWFIPSLEEFLSSARFSNIFYLTLVRDTLRLAKVESEENLEIVTFLNNFVESCRVDEKNAKKLIRIIVEECCACEESWCSELVQRLERQYPTVWDSVISTLLKSHASESLSRVLGLTSVTSQVQIFEKLNHVESCVRIDAIRWIAENSDDVKIKYVKSSLMSQWHDDDPSVIEAMFMLPEELRYYTTSVCEKLLLRCWRESNSDWNKLLTKAIESLKSASFLETNATKYTVLLMPFLVCSDEKIQELILEVDLPFMNAVRRDLKKSVSQTILNTLRNNSASCNVEELIMLYDELAQEHVHIFTLLLFLSASYTTDNDEHKLRILSCVFEHILPTHFKKLTWRSGIEWDQNSLEEYYKKTTRRAVREVIYYFLTCISEHTSVTKELTSLGWCDFKDQRSNLVSSLYEYLSLFSPGNDSSERNLIVSFFLEKHLTTLSDRIYFLLNMCLAHKINDAVLIGSFKIINSTLKSTTESFSWTAKMKSTNIVVPSILIFLYSTNSQLRTIIMETVEIICASPGLAISNEVTFVELLKYLAQHKEEIIFDREQLPSVVYRFLSQDRDVQALLPAAVRYLTKKIYDALFECITCESVPLSVSASLLPVVDFLQDKITLHKLIPLARRVLKSSQHPNTDSSAILRSVIEKFNAELGMFDKDEARELLSFCIDNCSKIKIYAAEGIVCLGTILLRQLASHVFDKSNKALQKYLLDSALKMLVAGESIDLVSAANSFMKKITLDGQLVATYLEEMKKVNLKESISTREAKQLEWSIGIALLEVTQNKKKITNCHAILPLLFDVLQKCCQVDEQIPMEYAKQLCLSCVLNCCQKLNDDDGAKSKTNIENLFNVELVVNCIRMSPNSQTHHHALMLLAYCASFAADQVLHNIMAIFTFMGSSVLRQDDAFSFQIISNILDTIVPLLIRDTGTDEKPSLTLCGVIRVFAASISDIPDHRRVPLLVKLMKILNDGDHLHVLVLFAMENAAKSGVKTIESKYVEAILELLMAMPVRQILQCLENTLIYSNSLPHNRDDETDCFITDDLLDTKTFKNKELHHFKYLLINFVSSVLSKTEFIQRVSLLECAEMKNLDVYFRGMIEQVILYVKTMSDYATKGKSSSSKYWKFMMLQAVEVLNKTNALLTCDTFLTIVKELINHRCLIVQRKTLELLNWRLQQSNDATQQDQFDVDDLVSVVPILMKVISSISKGTSDDCHDLKLNQQTGLISMKLLIKYFYSSNHAAKYKKILFKLSSLLSEREKINDHVLACLVLTIAELSASLKVHAIEALPKFVPEFLSIFKRYHEEEINQNDVLLMSVAVALQKLVETLPNFLSPYLESMLFEITCISARLQRIEGKSAANEDSRNSSIAHKMKLIRQKLSEIPSRVLLPSVSACFDRLCRTQNFEALNSLMSILADSFPQNGHFSSELTSLFLSSLDFRCTNMNNASEEEILLVESTVIDGLSKIILKCSETTFRPFYHKLYDWGVITSKEHSKKDRIITYYRILCCISEKLRSIFVLFASNFIRNAAELLGKIDGETNKLDLPPSKSLLLLDSIMKTLFNVFKYDTVKFLTKDRFDMLCEPLVNQLENTTIGDYETRSKEVIIPCLARFAATTTDDSLWKQFNYLILLKARHNSSEVRLAALDTVVAFATYLGDNFLPLLPETVPFLAELLEDENETVEKQTHKAVQKLEQILSEPIQKYF